MWYFWRSPIFHFFICNQSRCGSKATYCTFAITHPRNKKLEAIGLFGIFEAI